MNENELSSRIIGCAIEVHRQLGPGLLESAYQKCLNYELQKVGISTEIEKALPIVYKEIKLDHGYRIDILAENKVVVEVKNIEAIGDIHIAQTLTYMSLGKFKLGLILNFNVTSLKKGIKRLIK